MEKPEIKCLVLDIDGTLVGRSENISQTVKQAIGAAQKRGVYIAIANESRLWFYFTHLEGNPL